MPLSLIYSDDVVDSRPYTDAIKLSIYYHILRSVVFKNHHSFKMYKLLYKFPNFQNFTFTLIERFWGKVFPL